MLRNLKLFVMAQQGSLLKFSGHTHFRTRLVLSILSGKPVRIEKIRSDDKNPGLRGMGIQKIFDERNLTESVVCRLRSKPTEAVGESYEWHGH